MELEEIVKAADVVAERAYAPYSNFRVGAAVLTGEGSIYIGCNVENASYGLTACAERNAVGAMVGGGERNIELVAITSPDASPVLPCGACRQVLLEFGCRGIIVRGLAGELLHYTFDEMLPNAFGPGDIV